MKTIQCGLPFSLHALERNSAVKFELMFKDCLTFSASLLFASKKKTQVSAFGTLSFGAVRSRQMLGSYCLRCTECNDQAC